MGTGRLEAFTDGVVAIIITIMVLELKLPDGHDVAGLLAAAPSFLIYALSFVNVGLFWNNHHHMLHAARQVNGRVLWANLFLLFWLSLVPFVIRWIGEAGISPLPIAAYGFVLTLSGAGYRWLERSIIAANPSNNVLARAIGSLSRDRHPLAGSRPPHREGDRKRPGSRRMKARAVTSAV
jgi:uncharacterized membrane protein